VKRVLVTGGAGFVGSNLVAQLVREHECEVTVLDDLFTGSLDYLRGLNVEFIEGSVLDRDAVTQSAQGRDTVFHLAARNIIVSIENPREDMAVNIEGTFNVLEAAHRANVAKVVYTSTSSIYGNPRQIPIAEDELPSFLNFYSVSKFAGESYCRTFYEIHDLPVAVVRYSNVYGDNQSPTNPYCGVIGRFIASATSDEPLVIHGDGEQTRDFTYVVDACEATILAARSPKAVGEVFNVGTGVETSVNTLAGTIFELLGREPNVRYVDRRDIDNIRRRVMNVEKLRHHLKFSPSFTLRRGLEETIRWHRATAG
jgi:UDP-glucose 4-epimerase